MRGLQLVSFCLTVGVCFMAPIKRPASGVPDADVAWLQHSECALAMPEALLRLQNEEARLQRAGAYATMDDVEDVSWRRQLIESLDKRTFLSVAEIVASSSAPRLQTGCGTVVKGMLKKASLLPVAVALAPDGVRRKDLPRQTLVGTSSPASIAAMSTERARWAYEQDVRHGAKRAKGLLAEARKMSSIGDT
jgi:hypothetical protein|mmetsp:Transcript_23155/g.78201  ORF Transcript_23155/g.78201 Transcript_23155/m.78201 type:complete len:192 (-) Transcript_23155:421-996(-)